MSEVFCDGGFDGAEEAGFAGVQPKGVGADRLEERQVMGREDDNTGSLDHLVHAVFGFCDEGRIAGAEDFVDEKNFGSDAGGNAKGKPHSHAG